MIKLLIREDGSEIAIEWLSGTADVATSRVTYPEARAALAAAVRDRRLTTAEAHVAKAALRRILQEAILIEVDADLAHGAGELAERHALRGFDSIHLASAMSSEADWLATWDQDLVRAGNEAGVRVIGQSPQG